MACLSSPSCRRSTRGSGALWQTPRPVCFLPVSFREDRQEASGNHDDFTVCIAGGVIANRRDYMASLEAVAGARRRGAGICLVVAGDTQSPYGASVVAFDVLFAERQPVLIEMDDRQLGEILDVLKAGVEIRHGS